MKKRHILGCYFIFFGLLVLGLGVLGIFFGATYDHGGCGPQLRKFFLGIGVVYTIGGLAEFKRCCKCFYLSKLALTLVHCVGIPALVFAVLGSVWTWRASEICRSSANPWKRAEVLLFCVYGAVGLNFICNIVLLPLVGNLTRRMFKSNPV